jgi:hypothetical protein
MLCEACLLHHATADHAYEPHLHSTVTALRVALSSVVQYEGARRAIIVPLSALYDQPEPYDVSASICHIIESDVPHDWHHGIQVTACCPLNQISRVSRIDKSLYV